MNLVIPFSKDIVFDNNISQILSISLEHDYTINEGELLGNFYITGEYKTHEVSINKEHLEKTLPFSVSLSDRIDINTIDFNISNFTYDIIDNNILRINIEYIVNALEKEEKPIELDNHFREVEDVSFDELIDEEYLNDNNSSIESPKEINMSNDSIKIINDVNNIAPVSSNDTNNDLEETSKENEETQDTFITYNIHIMQDIDTIDAICTKYNTTTSLLEEYNDLSNLSVGDKIIIPEVDE